MAFCARLRAFSVNSFFRILMEDGVTSTNSSSAMNSSACLDADAGNYGANQLYSCEF